MLGSELYFSYHPVTQHLYIHNFLLSLWELSDEMSALFIILSNPSTYPSTSWISFLKKCGHTCMNFRVRLCWSKIKMKSSVKMELTRGEDVELCTGDSLNLARVATPKAFNLTTVIILSISFVSAFGLFMLLLLCPSPAGLNLPTKDI